MDALAGIFIVENGSNRDLQGDVSALGAGFVGAFAVASTAGLVLGIETEVDERVVALAGFHPHIAAPAAVAARGPATGDKLLAPEGHASVAAVAGFDFNPCFVNEHVGPVLGSQFSVLRKCKISEEEQFAVFEMHLFLNWTDHQIERPRTARP